MYPSKFLQYVYASPRRQMQAESPISPPTLAPVGRRRRSPDSPPSPSPSITSEKGDGGTPAPSPSITSEKGGSSVGLVAGVVVGVVVFLAALVALVVWVRRRRKAREEGGGTNEAPDGAKPQLRSSFPLLESQVEKRSPGLWSWKKNRKVDGDLQSPKAVMAPQQVVYIPDYQSRPSLYSGTSTSSSLSTGDNTQSPLVSVGVRSFAYEDLSHATNRFSQDNFLGRGGFGSVYRGVRGNGADGDIVVAIKVLQDGSFQGEREFLTEINVISRVHHRNLVSLVGYCVSGLERLLVYEYLENNNLAFHLQGTLTTVLDWPTRMSIALGAAKGIAYLHEECHPRIVHRDIKSSNILLDSNFGAKVADFGLAKFVPDNQTHVTTRVIGTLGYLAPEFGSSGRLTEKSDVFSFGVVLLELITGRQAINLVEWGRPLLDQALEDGKFASELIDPKLANNYAYEEMDRMVTCAAISVHHFPDHRPRMSQVVHVLQGNVSPEKLKAETNSPRIRQPA